MKASFLNQKNYLTEINNDSRYYEINKKHAQILGRHKDPTKVFEI